MHRQEPFILLYLAVFILCNSVVLNRRHHRRSLVYAPVIAATVPADMQIKMPIIVVHYGNSDLNRD